MDSKAKDELSGPALRLWETLESVTIVKGHIPSDPTIYRIQIDGKCIEVDAEKMDRPTTFKKKFLKMFYRPPAYMTPNEWSAFVELLGETAEVITAQEESEAVYIAREVMEKIREMPVSEEPEEAATGRVFLMYMGYLCLKGTKITEIVESMRYHILPNKLSEAMTHLGLKKSGTPRIRCGAAGQHRFWWFYESAINEDGQDDNPLELPEKMDCVPVEV
jgi:hypothetical protein